MSKWKRRIRKSLKYASKSSLYALKPEILILIFVSSLIGGFSSIWLSKRFASITEMGSVEFGLFLIVIILLMSLIIWLMNFIFHFIGQNIGKKKKT